MKKTLFLVTCKCRESLCKVSSLDWQFYLYLTGLLDKFELSAQTAKKTCLNHARKSTTYLMKAIEIMKNRK